MAESIFERPATLKPSAMAVVAERRFADAEALSATDSNARANGAAYLVGFAVEILLKARLIDRYPQIAKKRQHDLQVEEREVWRLIWREHDLAAMLDRLPQLQAALAAKSARTGTDYLADLKKICATWTIFARYSPRATSMFEARQLLERVRLIKEQLK